MSEGIKERVWKNIRAIRIKKRLSQKVVAKKAGLHLKSLERIERSPQNLTLEHIDAIALALGVSIAELLDIVEPFPVKKSKARYIRSAEAIEYAIEILDYFKKTTEKD